MIHLKGISDRYPALMPGSHINHTQNYFPLLLLLLCRTEVDASLSQGHVRPTFLSDKPEQGQQKHPPSEFALKQLCSE